VTPSAYRARFSAGKELFLVRRRIHPAFVVAGAVFVVLLCAAAVRATPSILIVPLEREFGWSRALLSSAVSVNLVLYGLVGPFRRRADGALRHPADRPSLRWR